MSDPPVGPLQHASNVVLATNEDAVRPSNTPEMAIVLIALSSLWAIGLFVALVFCRIAAAGDRDLRFGGLSTHEFGLRA